MNITSKPKKEYGVQFSSRIFINMIAVEKRQQRDHTNNCGKKMRSKIIVENELIVQEKGEWWWDIVRMNDFDGVTRSTNEPLSWRWHFSLCLHSAGSTNFPRAIENEIRRPPLGYEFQISIYRCTIPLFLVSRSISHKDDV